MENKVSELMDGELDRQGVSNVLGAIKNDQELQEKWETYHLIGDVLRRSSCLSINVSPDVKQRLKTEPVVFSPILSRHNDKKQKVKVFAFAIAASVIAMITGGIFMNQYSVPKQITVAEQSKPEHGFNVAPVMVSNPSTLHQYAYPPIEMNDYLFVHREFSPGGTMRSHTTGVNSVPELNERYGR